MTEVGLGEVETYIPRCQKKLAQYIATRPMIDLCLAAKRRPWPRVAIRWWEQEGLDFEGMWTVDREAEEKEGAEETDGTETAMGY